MIDKIKQNILWETSRTKRKETKELDIEKNKKRNFGLWETVQPFEICEKETRKWTRRFMIEKIYDTENKKILYGKGIEVSVEGDWKNTLFNIGNYVYFIKCGCEIKNYNNIGCNNSNNNIDNSDNLNFYSSNSNSFIEKWIVTNDINFIILESDIITVTSFCAVLRCENEVFLKKNIANISFEECPKSMVIGRIVHALLEECLISKQCNFNFIITTLKRIISEMGEIIYLCGSTEREILNETLKHVRHIISFYERKMNIEYIEKEVMSKEFALRGIIDCMADNTIIEFKTGLYEDISHRAQVLLYTAMINMNQGHSICGNPISIDITDSSIKYKPMLFFTKSGHVSNFEVRHGEMAKLLQLRNRIGDGNIFTECKCSQNIACNIYREITLLDNTHFLRQQLTAIEDEFNISQIYLRCIRAKDDDFNGRLARLEFTGDVPINNRLTIYTREQKLCTAGNVISRDDKILTLQLDGVIGLSRELFVTDELCGITFKYMKWALVHILYPRYFNELTLKERRGFYLPGEKESVENIFKNKFDSNVNEISNLDLSDYTDFIFSDDEIIHTDNSTISFDSLDNFSHSIELSNIDLSPSTNLNKSIELIDIKSDTTNLNKSDFASNPNIKNTHDYINNNSSLYFTQRLNPETNDFFISIPKQFYLEFNKLNDGQKIALYEALNCKNFKIIHGMPGTGKSTLISLLIKILAYYNKKVLIVCYTHSAIDNIIAKLGSLSYYRSGSKWSNKFKLNNSQLFNLNSNPLRTINLRSKNFIHPTKSNQITYPLLSNSTVIKNVINSASIVFGTCFSFSDIIFINNTFDYCIIDEGSQMHFLLALLPISLSNRFCILGDHLQLKPLAKKNKNISLSLFEYLKEDCVSLTKQYRMGDEIMNLSNTLFYAGRLIGNGSSSTVTFIDTRYNNYLDSINGSVVLCYFNSVVRTLELTNASFVTTIDKYQGSESDSIAVIFHPVINTEIMQSRERLNVALTRAKSNLILIGNPDDMKVIPVFRELLHLLGI